MKKTQKLKTPMDYVSPKIQVLSVHSSLPLLNQSGGGGLELKELDEVTVQW